MGLYNVLNDESKLQTEAELKKIASKPFEATDIASLKEQLKKALLLVEEDKTEYASLTYHI